MDFWFTIVTTDPIIEKKINEIRKKELEKLFNKYKIPIKSNEIIPKLLQAKRNIMRMKKEQGHVDFSSRDFQIPYILEYMVPETSSNLTKTNPILKEKLLDSLSEIVTESLLFNKPPLIPYVKQALEYVKAQGLKLGIVSNTGFTKGETLRKILQEYELLQLFDEILYSDEVEVMKPNPKFFQILANKLNLDPSEIVHVGDTIYSDIFGARNAGLHEGILILGAFNDLYQYTKTEDDFAEFKPRYVIDDYRDFPEALNAITSGKNSFLKIHNEKIRKRLKI